MRHQQGEVKQTHCSGGREDPLVEQIYKNLEPQELGPVRFLDVSQHGTCKTSKANRQNRQPNAFHEAFGGVS